MRRRIAAFTASLFLHALVLVAGLVSFSAGFEMPDIEIEFTEVTLLDPNVVQAKEPPPEEPTPVLPPPPEDGGKASEKDEGKEAAEDATKEPEKPKPRLGERPARVDRLGPTNATFYAFLVNRRIRRLPFADQGLEVMAPLPDFQFLVQGGGFHPLRDFDYMVIASPDVRDVTQTFLAVEHRLPREEIVAAVERAAAAQDQVVTWEERDGRLLGNPRPSDPRRPDVDPRWIVLLDDRVAVYVREEFLPHVLAGPDGERKTSGNFVANLTRMRRFAAREPRAGMQVVLKDLHRALKRVRGLPFPVPNDAQLTVEASRAPEVVMTLAFRTRQEAEAFADWYRDDLARILDDNWTIKAVAGWIYRLIEMTRDGRSVRLSGKFTTKQAESILKMLAGFSRKLLHKTPEEAERDRLAREEMWRRRKGGRLPPSAAFASEESGSTGGSTVLATGGAAPPSRGTFESPQEEAAGGPPGPTPPPRGEPEPEVRPRLEPPPT